MVREADPLYKPEHFSLPGRARSLEILRFLLVGGAGFLFEYALLFLLTEFAGLPYLWSSGIAFTISAILNYWLCVVYVFHGAQQQSGRQTILFFLTSLIGLGINQLCMWLLVDGAGLYYMIAKIFASAVVTVWNYIMKHKVLLGSFFHGNTGEA